MKLNKTMLAALQECADYCTRDTFGMHEAWKRKTMPRLAALGLVEKRDGLRNRWAGSEFSGWVITAAGRAELSNITGIPDHRADA